MNVAIEQPIQVGAALLASAEGYTPTAQQLIEKARARLGTIGEVAEALADNLPAPKAPAGKSRRRRRKKRDGQPAATPEQNGEAAAEVVASAEAVPASPSDAPPAADAVETVPL